MYGIKFLVALQFVCNDGDDDREKIDDIIQVKNWYLGLNPWVVLGTRIKLEHERECNKLSGENNGEDGMGGQ